MFNRLPFLRWRIGLLASALVLSLIAGSGGAHPARQSDDHGALRAEGNPAGCTVDVTAEGVDFGFVTFQVLRPAAGEPSLVTQETSSGAPAGGDRFGPGPAFFDHFVRIEITADEARNVDRVRMAFTDSEGEAHSAVAFFEDFACVVPEGATAPDCPPGVTATPRDDPDNPAIRVEWDVVEDADAYRVYRATGEGPFALQIQEDQSVTGFFNDETVEPGQTYRYRVTAINDAGESEGCPAVEATAAGERDEEEDEPPVSPPSPSRPPVCMDTLRAEALAGGAVLLDWESPVEGPEADFFRVTRRVADEEGPREVLAEVVGETQFTDETAEPGVTYVYRVEAHARISGPPGSVFTVCGSAEVTAIPFFGAPLLAALALAGSVGAYGVLRRKA